MAEQIKISLFTNKKTKDTQPDYKYSFKLNDEWVNVLAGWKRKTKTGEDYIFLVIDPSALFAFNDNTKTKTKYDAISTDDIPF